MKNNRGYTLVELLITVTIMLLVLGVAIVNFASVGNRQKKRAWESVKNEIETAAEQYFKSNEYLFEGIGNAEAKITIDELVKDDFLNKVVDPRTGLMAKGCIKVSKNNGVFSTSFVDSSDSACTNNGRYNYSVSVKEIGAPEIEFSYVGKTVNDLPDDLSEVNAALTGISLGNKKDFGDWYVGENVKINIKFSEPIKELRRCVKKGTKCENFGSNLIASNVLNYQDIQEDDTSGTYFCYEATSKYGKKSKDCTEKIKLDGTPPTCKINVQCTKGENDWCKSDATISMNYTENGSGVYKHGMSSDGSKPDYNEKIKLTQSGDTKKIAYYGFVMDNAGNNVTCAGYVKVDKTAPSCTISIRSNAPKNEKVIDGNSFNHNSYVNDTYSESKVSIKITDSISGVDESKKSLDNSSNYYDYLGNATSEQKLDGYIKRNYTAEVYDMAGNHKTCTKSYNFLGSYIGARIATITNVSDTSIDVSKLITRLGSTAGVSSTGESTIGYTKTTSTTAQELQLQNKTGGTVKSAYQGQEECKDSGYYMGDACTTLRMSARLVPISYDGKALRYLKWQRIASDVDFDSKVLAGDARLILRTKMNFTSVDSGVYANKVYYMEATNNVCNMDPKTYLKGSYLTYGSSETVKKISSLKKGTSYCIMNEYTDGLYSVPIKVIPGQQGTYYANNLYY